MALVRWLQIADKTGTILGVFQELRYHCGNCGAEDDVLSWTSSSPRVPGRMRKTYRGEKKDGKAGRAKHDLEALAGNFPCRMAGSFLTMQGLLCEHIQPMWRLLPPSPILMAEGVCCQPAPSPGSSAPTSVGNWGTRITVTPERVVPWSLLLPRQPGFKRKLVDFGEVPSCQC